MVQTLVRLFEERCTVLEIKRNTVKSLYNVAMKLALKIGKPKYHKILMICSI